MSKILSTRLFIAIALVLVLAAAAYGFAAANTMPASINAGDGSRAISGYVISNVHFTLAADADAAMTNVTFDIAPAVPASGFAYVSLDGGTTWIDCGTGGSLTCLAPGTPLAASQFQVVAAQ